MKRIMRYCASLWLILCTISCNAAIVSGIPTDKQKKPARVSTVQGDMPYKYGVVSTTVRISPQTKIGKSAAPQEKVVQRQLVGYVGGGAGAAVRVDKQLNTPMLGFNIKSDVPEMIADIVGTVDPDPADQVIAQTAALIINDGLDLINQQLNNAFGNNPYELSMIEIIPQRYYRIVGDTVELTNNFTQDLGKYLDLMKKYEPVAREWNDIIRKYNKARDTWEKNDPQMTDAATINQLNTMYDREVKPALTRKLEIENQLTTYSLHRIAIMPNTQRPGSSCEKEGYNGPWSFLVYYYIGAKQTNVFTVDFCVTNLGQEQQFIVNLVPNRINQQAVFIPGGVKLVASRERNLTFPIQESAEHINYRSPETPVFSWFDELISSPDGKSINAYLFPFDVVKIEQALQSKTDEASKKRLEQFKKNLEKIRTETPSRSSETSTSSEQEDEKLNELLKTFEQES